MRGVRGVSGLLRREVRSAHRAARLIRQALQPPDPRTQPGPVRRMDPKTGQLLETVTATDWMTRYPKRRQHPTQGRTRPEPRPFW